MTDTQPDRFSTAFAVFPADRKRPKPEHASVVFAQLADADEWVATNQARTGADSYVRQVDAAEGHEIIIGERTKTVQVGGKPRRQVWFTWACFCGDGAAEDAASSHRSLAAVNGAAHLLATVKSVPAAPARTPAPAAAPAPAPTPAPAPVPARTPARTRKASPAVVERKLAAAKEILTGYRMTWTHTFADGTTAARTGTIWSKGPQLRSWWTIPDEALATDAYPAVLVHIDKEDNRTSIDLPQTDELGATEAVDAAMEAATVSLHGAQPQLVTVTDRGEVDGYRFRLAAGSHTRELGRLVRQAINRHADTPKGAITVTAPAGSLTVNLVAADGWIVDDWSAVLAVAREAIGDAFAAADEPAAPARVPVAA